jgi:3-oxoacyl-(acyl-carrier-protein) synthase
MGSGIGGLTNIEETSRTLHDSGPRRISPFFVPGSIINMISGFLSIHLGAQGPNYAIATACTTGTHCIGMAARNIAYDEADVMIAGGSEMAACGLGMGGFGASRACRPATTNRPAPAVRGTRAVMASCCPTVPVPWCSKNWSTPRRAVRPSMPN